MKKIAIIGGGNIGQAIGKGLLMNPLIDNASVTITRRNIGKLEEFKNAGMRVTSNNKAAVTDSDIVILAVQPAQVPAVVAEIAGDLDPAKHALCSVVTAVSCSDLQLLVNKPVPVYLIMPNTAAAIGQSMTCIVTESKNEVVNKDVEAAFKAVGRVMYIDASLMPSATVIAACGIAYAMRFIRAASQGGTEIGFHAEEALELAAQTVKGAAELLLSRGLHPEKEIDKVTTPMGCTIAGLNEMEHRGFSSALIKGIVTSRNKISDMEPIV